MSMSASSTVGSKAETPLEKERKLFGELFPRLVDASLNRLFDLRPETAARRTWYLIALFLFSGFVVSLRVYPPVLWAKHIRDVFSFLLSPDFAAAYRGNAVLDFLAFIIQVWTDPRIFQYLPVFLAPFFIALQCAALYLADVFELEQVSVARSFIWAVALSGSEELVRVSQGEIAEEFQQSPAYLIGGPGKVIVDLDSAALFEKPDGTPRVIGPTGKEPRGRATLEGFERFRQAIDIRDQYVDLRDQDPRSQSVKSRSLDGIPITATDVRLMFSIYRGGAKPSADLPYPFSPEAVEHIIYQATSRVTPELPNPSTYEFSWINKMIGLIRRELGTFMSRHKLTAYLASIGAPEVEKLKQREEAIVEQTQKLTPSGEDILGREEQNAPPDFQARYKITNLFAEFAEEFTRRAQSSGVELHWIGVGTWKTPGEFIPERHLEAWKLSNDNLYRESSDVLAELEKEAIMQKTVALIQDVPIAVRMKSGLDGNDHTQAMRSLLLAYQQQLIEAADFMRAKGEAVPPNLAEAISHINNMFGHFL